MQLARARYIEDKRFNLHVGIGWRWMSVGLVLRRFVPRAEGLEMQPVEMRYFTARHRRPVRTVRAQNGEAPCGNRQRYPLLLEEQAASRRDEQVENADAGTVGMPAAGGVGIFAGRNIMRHRRRSESEH